MYRREFILISDHEPLKWIDSVKPPVQRLRPKKVTFKENPVSNPDPPPEQPPVARKRLSGFSSLVLQAPPLRVPPIPEAEDEGTNTEFKLEPPPIQSTTKIISPPNIEASPKD